MMGLGGKQNEQMTSGRS